MVGFALPAHPRPSPVIPRLREGSKASAHLTSHYLGAADGEDVPSSPTIPAPTRNLGRGIPFALRLSKGLKNGMGVALLPCAFNLSSRGSARDLRRWSTLPAITCMLPKAKTFRPPPSFRPPSRSKMLQVRLWRTPLFISPLSPKGPKGEGALPLPYNFDKY